jgi:hypothetical protein
MRLNYLDTYRLLKSQRNPGIHLGTFDADITTRGIGSAVMFETGQRQIFRSMETNSISRFVCVSIVAALLFLMSACTIASYHSLESAAFLAPQNNINQLAANDSFNQCNEQRRLLKHEIALCRAVP